MDITVNKDKHGKYSVEINVSSTLNGKNSYQKFKGEGDSKREALEQALDSLRFGENRIKDAKEEIKNNW